MTFIILICWLLPLAMAAAVLGSYLAFGLGRQTRQGPELLPTTVSTRSSGLSIRHTTP